MIPLSTHYLLQWLDAFVLTQLVEMPIYAWLLSSRFGRHWRTLLLAFGASAITHPIVWFVVPWRAWEYTTAYVVAETFAVLTEAAYLAIIGIPKGRALLWALIANASSVAFAEFLRRVVGVRF